MIFVAKYISAMAFGGSILGGARRIWGNPYLNSMTVLFDMGLKVALKNYVKPYKMHVLWSCANTHGANTNHKKLFHSSIKNTFSVPLPNFSRGVGQDHVHCEALTKIFKRSFTTWCSLITL